MNNITWRLANAAYRIINPLFWIQIQPTSYKYDASLRRALDEHPVKRVSEYRCKINGVEIWVSNYPYCFGHSMPGKFLPAPLTRVRLRKAMRRHPKGLL